MLLAPLFQLCARIKIKNSLFPDYTSHHFVLATSRKANQQPLDRQSFCAKTTTKMDYEQFYRYLDSRPFAEIEDCVRNVLKLAKKHNVNVDTEHESEDLSKLHRLQVSQRVWLQHAVWNKFGSSNVEHTSLKDLRQDTAVLFETTEVAAFLLRVNKMIDVELPPRHFVEKALTVTVAEKLSNSPKR